MFEYRTRGTCSRKIQFEIEDNILTAVNFIGGCEGNLIGISQLAKGRSIDELIPLLKGIDCHGKGTSCPDQLANALQAYKESLAQA